MDFRTQFINDVMERLIDYPSLTLDQIQYVLLDELNDYELSERTTEVAIYDDSSYGMIKKFIATKKYVCLDKEATRYHYNRAVA